MSTVPYDPTRRRFLGQALVGGLLACLPRPGYSGSPANTTGMPVPVQAWGRRGSGPDELASPIALAFNRQDELFAADALNRRVQVFRTDGTFLRSLSLDVRPAGVAVAPDGTVYVSNWTRHTVAVFSPAGQPLREMGRMGTGPGEFRLPGGLACGPDGSLYVTDQGNSRIQRFSSSGALLRVWGGHGSGPGQFGAGSQPGERFAGPQFLAVDQHSRVYATDTASFRVERFSADGEFQVQWSNSSGGPGGFGPRSLPIAGPTGIGVDHQGCVWVAGTNHRVQKFSDAGRYLGALGTDQPGEAPGQFHVPHGIAFDSLGCMYIADTLNFRIQKFSFARPGGPK